MRLFKTGILIHDYFLKKMQNNGLNVSYEILSDIQYVQELKIKLVEEANECLNALISNKQEDKNDLKHELADVLEVVEHLAKAVHLDMREILKIKAEKKEKIGGFESKIKTHYIEVADDNLEELNYYLQYPDKHPEITDK